jgi:hypothetical protein
MNLYRDSSHKPKKESLELRIDLISVKTIQRNLPGPSRLFGMIKSKKSVK